MRLTKRFIIDNLYNLSLSDPIRYERYYISDKLRVQKKGNKYEKEVLDEDNNILCKFTILKEEFITLKLKAYSEIIRDSYIYLNDKRISIKRYYGDYEGLNRVEVEFNSIDEMNNYNKEVWMESEITDSPLAFDKYLSKLSREEFLSELYKFNK